MPLYLFVTTPLMFGVLFFSFSTTHFFHAVSQSPAIMHMLDKSGSCGKFENYQRPEGFPVGMYLLAAAHFTHNLLFLLTLHCCCSKS